MPRHAGRALQELLPQLKGLLIRMPNWMGDILLARPVLARIRETYPHLSLHALVPEHYFELFKIYGYFDEIHPLPVRQKFHIWKTCITLRKMYHQNPWLGIPLPNSFESALELALIGCPWRYGFATNARSLFLTHLIECPSNTLHETVRWFRLIEHLLPLSQNITQKESELPSLTIPQDWQGTFPCSHPHPWIFIHAGGSKKEKRWPIERYIRLGHRLEKEGFHVHILTDEPVQTTQLCIHHKIPFRAFVDGLHQSTLFIGNDSGPAHLSASFHKPTFILYGPGHPSMHHPIPSRWAFPLTLNWPCSPCKQRFFHECRPSQPGLPSCLDALPYRWVESKILEFIRTNRSPIFDENEISQN